MNSQQCSSEEDEYELSRSVHCWWRSAAKFDECVKVKYDLPNVSSLTPRLKVLKEMERLALIAPEGLNELRHKLQMYRSGDFWVPVGGISKEEMDIPPTITILLVGFTGSGKSSLVNLMYSVLGRSGIIPFAQTSLGNQSQSQSFCVSSNLINLHFLCLQFMFDICREFFKLHYYVDGRAQCVEEYEKWVLCV
jgi:hypothetical protein